MNKLAIFCTSLYRGGAEHVAVILAGYFVRRQIPVVMITEFAVEDEYELPAAVKRINLAKNMTGAGIVKKSMSFIPQIRKLHRTLKEESIGTMLVIGTPCGVYALPGTIGTGVKVIMSERNAPGRFDGLAGKWQIKRRVGTALMRFADGFVFQTSEAKAYYSKALHNRGTVIFNPLETDSLPPRYSGPRDKRIVAVGRLEVQKNHRMLLRAFAQIAPEFPGYTLEIYGNGSERQSLQDEADRLGLRERVRFAGNVPDVFEKIASAAMFAMSSDFEGMPNALIEAMAVGLPCVSTDCPCGGPRELICSGKNGLLTPVGDAVQLAQAMRELLSQPDMAEKMGGNAFAIRERLCVSRIGQQWMDYIMSV